MSRKFKEKEITTSLQAHSIQETNNHKESLCNNAECPLPGPASVQQSIHMVRHPGAHRKDSSVGTDMEQSS